jgi:hypothetical protein
MLRIDRNSTSDFKGRILLSDFILRTFYFMFELTIFVIFMRSVFYFANRKRKQIAREEYGLMSNQITADGRVLGIMPGTDNQIKITRFHKFVITAVLIIALMNLEYSMFSFYYSLTKYLDDDLDIDGENPNNNTFTSK